MPTSPDYYALRAPHYEALYSKPERQSDLADLKTRLSQSLAGRHILEIACGTGYWTQAIAETALQILATDINEPMLEVARAKQYPPGKVAFECNDMYQLSPGHFNALFGGFIWSHILWQDLPGWLDHLHQLLRPGSRVVFTDNCFVAGSNTPIAETDSFGNTYQLRPLPDGSSHLVVKNFPKRSDIAALMNKRAARWAFSKLSYYWMLEYELPPAH